MKPLYLLLTVALTGCVTTTITKPDGTVIKTSSTDPAIVQAAAAGLAQGVTAGIAQLPRGYSK